jgi:protein-tyrosine phosphatase
MYSAPLDTPMDVFEFFNEVHNFIDEALNNGKNVMVHCLAGAH